MDPVTILAISSIAQFINQCLTREQQEETEKQRRADRYGPEEGALRREIQLEQAKLTFAINDDQHRKRLIEDQHRILLQRRAALGADILLPGTWWDSRRPNGSGPLIVVDIGPRTTPAGINGPTTLDAPLDYLTRSLKQEYAAYLTPRLDVLFDCLCIDSEGTARGFHYTELRGHPAILVYGKSAGNHVYIDAVFSRLLCDDAAGPGELEWQTMARFPRSLCADLAMELQLADPTRVLELFDMICDVAVNTKLLNLLDIHFGLRDDAYTPRAHAFFFRRRQDLIDRGLWPEGNRDLRKVEQVMEGYPERIDRLRSEAAKIRQQGGLEGPPGAHRPPALPAGPRLQNRTRRLAPGDDPFDILEGRASR